MLSDSEWLASLEKADGLKEDYSKKAAGSFHAQIEPVREAVENKRFRDRMKKSLKYDSNRPQTCDAPILSGDRVIAKNNQCASKTGHGKFETKNGQVRQYVVQSVSQGFVQLQEVGAGAFVYKHEANLKLMPRKLVADDQHAPSLRIVRAPSRKLASCGGFLKVPSLGDGRLPLPMLQHGHAACGARLAGSGLGRRHPWGATDEATWMRPQKQAWRSC